MNSVSRVLVLAGLVFSVACGGGPLPPEKPPPDVATAAVQTRRVEVVLPFLGRVESSAVSQLRSLEEGRVESVLVADGAPVAAGRLVFRIGGPRAEARSTALRKVAKAAERRLGAARAHLEQSTRRAAAHLAGPGETAAAQQEVAAAEGALAEARASMERFEAAMEVKAPVAGRFIGRTVSEGQEVEPGEVLGAVLDPGSLRVTAEVMPRAGLQPSRGQRAEIERSGGEPLVTVVSAVQPVAGAAGTARVWLTGEALARMVPGTVVRGGIVVALHEKAVTIPRAAVVRDRNDRPLVFIGSAPSFEEHSVTTGVEGADWIEITSGLAAGDEVVTRGAYELYWSSFGKEFKVAD